MNCSIRRSRSGSPRPVSPTPPPSSQPARLASAAVVILTTGKVFLYDLAGVQGVYRAFSFIGLGIVLIGIGLLYQRLLFPPRPQIPPEAASTSPQAG